MIERQIFSRILDDLSDRYDNAGCNDFSIPNTPEGKEFAERVVRYALEGNGGILQEEVDDWVENTCSTESESIILFDWQVLHYLRSLFGFPTTL